MDDLDKELFEAVKNNDIEVAKILIKNGADVNIEDEDNRSLLHHAAMNGLTQMAKLLINEGAIVDALDYWDNTPMDLAVCNGWLDTAGLLEKAFWRKVKKNISTTTTEEKIDCPETIIIPVVKMGHYSLTQKAFDSSVYITGNQRG